MSKVGCAFQVVIWPEFRMGKYLDNDHQEDAHHFMIRNEPGLCHEKVYKCFLHDRMLEFLHQHIYEVVLERFQRNLIALYFDCPTEGYACSYGMSLTPFSPSRKRNNFNAVPNPDQQKKYCSYDMGF